MSGNFSGEELEILSEIDRRLRIEGGILRDSLCVSDLPPAAARDRILQALREQRGPEGVHERLWRVRWVLALLCGSNTAARIVAAAESHAGVPRGSKLCDRTWAVFLRRLAFLTTEICGCYAGELILAVGE